MADTSGDFEADPDAAEAPPAAPEHAETPSPETPPGEPTPKRPRVRQLDVIRGIAVLGILPVNILAMALPMQHAGHVPEGDFASELVVRTTELFFQFRFVSIFSFLFGVGLILFHQSVSRRGMAPMPALLRRLITLIAFGTVHGILLWYGDILAFYGFVGLLALIALHWQPRTLVVVGASLVLVPLLLVLLISGVCLFDDTPMGTVGDPVAAEEAFYSGNSYGELFWKLDPFFEELVYVDGPLSQQFALRGYSWLILLVFGMFIFGHRVAGLFLLGMAAAKSQWFLEGKHAGRLIGWGLGVGLPIGLAGTIAATLLPDNEGVRIGVAGIQFIASCGLATGYVGLAIVLSQRFARLSSVFEAVGRLAFTNYLLQSFLAGLVFHSWGLGKFGAWSPGQLPIFVLAVWAIIIAWSVWWLPRFGMGPFERLWRWATYAGRIPQ